MHIKTFVSGSLLTAVLPMIAGATNIVVNPGFDSAIGGIFSTSPHFAGAALTGSGAAASGAQIYDDGWVVFSSGNVNTNPLWNITGGVIQRSTALIASNYGGFGQFISNPNNGNFDNGDKTVFAFDYVYNGTTGGELVGSIYGVTAPNGVNATWNPSPPNGNESILNAGQISTPSINIDYTSGADYQFYLLNTFSDTTASSVSATYTSSDITLTRQYDFFVVVFQAKAGTGAVTLDNVSFSDVAVSNVPEPASGALVVGLSALTLVGLRRRKTKA
jgi:hypothetical protein